MYLERFRRTRVSNILKSIDGRVLPAVHADGSVISILAIIQRADSQDGSSGLLFKGTIKRGDVTGSMGANARRGFKENYEITLNKSGVIMGIKRQILTMLGHAQEKLLTEFIGQPIEILVPNMPDRPTQNKSNWIPRALKDPQLNFYLLMVTKTYSIFPVSYNMTFNSEDDTITMRIRDMTELDALLKIDEVGTLLSVNDDAFILLGYNGDDVVGRNIKHIQPPDVAEAHDGYLLRYKTTQVARVVGIARTVNSMHRDGSLFSTEIQVTEQKMEDGAKNFIGRLRHRKFDERIPRGIFQRIYFKNWLLVTILIIVT
jgi:PAS domain S-box-containing protein